MRLLDLVIRRQLNGEVGYSYSRKGLSVKLAVPLTHERWPGRSAQSLPAAHRCAEKLSVFGDLRPLPLPQQIATVPPDQTGMGQS
jgi:hypothetical protein